MLSDQQKEMMDILQEECAEVIQAVSKIRRFGLKDKYQNKQNNHDILIQELGDVVMMIILLSESGLFTETDIVEASARKLKKLQKWSTIFNK